MKLNIGKNIKRLRGEKGVTQEQLAEVMNVTCRSGNVERRFPI